MSLRPSETIHKALLSTPSSFVGEFSTDAMLISHAWHGSGRGRRLEDGSSARNAFVVAFETEEIVKAPGVVFPDYSYIGTTLAAYLSVLYGKRFDSHGLVETHGSFSLPDLEQFAAPVRLKLPQNSRDVRVDFQVPLDLREVSRIAPLMFQADVSVAFKNAFSTAAKFYAQALQVVERDAEVAYLHLVTAIEILSGQTEIPPEDLYDEETKRYFAEFEQDLPNGRDVVKHFRKHMMAIKRRYIRTISSLVDSSFFSRSECKEQFGQLSEDSFLKCVAAAYDLRSQYVHTGTPFGFWISNSLGAANTEVMIGRPNVEGKSLAKALERAPTFVGLERIVRFCLLKAASNQGLYLNPGPAVDPVV